MDIVLRWIRAEIVVKTKNYPHTHSRKNHKKDKHISSGDFKGDGKTQFVHYPFADMRKKTKNQFKDKKYYKEKKLYCFNNDLKKNF